MEQQTNQINELSNKEKKKLLTAYWGIRVDSSDILNNIEIKTFLETHKELIPLTKMHSTLLFVGKKICADEIVFEPHKDKIYSLTINQFGYNDNALAIEVANINPSVPTFAIKQHITVALKTGEKAVNSVKTLIGEGNIITLEKPLIINGIVTKYLF